MLQTNRKQAKFFRFKNQPLHGWIGLEPTSSVLQMIHLENNEVSLLFGSAVLQLSALIQTHLTLGSGTYVGRLQVYRIWQA